METYKHTYREMETYRHIYREVEVREIIKKLFWLRLSNIDGCTGRSKNRPLRIIREERYKRHDHEKIRAKRTYAIVLHFFLIESCNEY